MKKLLRIAMAAALAGALIHWLRKRAAVARAREDEAFDDRVGLGGLPREQPTDESQPASPDPVATNPSIH